jgi:hypothetical protein
MKTRNGGCLASRSGDLQSRDSHKCFRTALLVAAIFLIPMTASGQNRDGIFAIINGEQSGYIEALVYVSRTYSGIVRVENLHPKFYGREYVKTDITFKFAVRVKTEVVDPDGRKKKVKAPIVARAGPGEQITIGFTLTSIYDPPSTAAIIVEYFSNEGVLLGRTEPVLFQFQRNQRAAKSWTFRRSDLTSR